jgi:hypothetical protein
VANGSNVVADDFEKSFCGGQEYGISFLTYTRVERRPWAVELSPSERGNPTRVSLANVLRREHDIDGPSRREAPSRSGCGRVDQALQRQSHHFLNVGSREVIAAQLQLGDEAPEEDAALLYG